MIRRMSTQDRQWLASRYGQEIDMADFEDLRALSVSEAHAGSNGVEVTHYTLNDGRTATRHSGMWETFFYVSA